MNTIEKETCIFCKIITGDVPCYKIYEDEYFLAFLDINPRAPGHVQVIPKEHMRFVWNHTNIGNYFKVVQKIAKALQKAYGQELVRSQIYGEEVFHAHVWVWPDLPNDGTEKDFKSHVEIIKKYL